MVAILLSTLLVLHLLEIVLFICILWLSEVDSKISVEVRHTKSEENSGYDDLYQQAREANRESDKEESGGSSSDELKEVSPRTPLEDAFD